MPEKFSTGARIVLILLVVAMIVLAWYVHWEEQEAIGWAKLAEKSFNQLATKVDALNNKVIRLEKQTR